jgi:3-deoxy-manno-octulosonate cytidylyltransferase (CMP-KDO synthetase)
MHARWRPTIRCSRTSLVFHVIIPARFGSIRLPGKALLPIDGQPLIQRVWQRAQASGARSVVIATDDERISAAARGFGAECVMTAADHASGTDRIAEVARSKKFAADDIVVNLQGDEPMMPAEVIQQVAESLRSTPSADISTALAPVESLSEFLDPNCVKAVRGLDGRALYFSRAPIPWPRDSVAADRPTSYMGAWRHIGIYGYRVRSLLQFAAWPPCALELSEKLEQLRALERGMLIQTVALTKAPPGGVDTPQDLERVRAALATGA